MMQSNIILQKGLKLFALFYHFLTVIFTPYYGLNHGIDLQVNKKIYYII